VQHLRIVAKLAHNACKMETTEAISTDKNDATSRERQNGDSNR
jgi:hypothetical protein